MWNKNKKRNKPSAAFRVGLVCLQSSCLWPFGQGDTLEAAQADALRIAGEHGGYDAKLSPCGREVIFRVPVYC